MKSAIKKTVALLLAMILAGSLLTGCAAGAPEPAPEDTVAALEQAVNDADVEAVLNCLSSDLVTRIRPMLALLAGEDGSSAGKTLDMLRVLMPLLPVLTEGAVEGEDLPRIGLTPEKTEQDGEEATVCVTGVLSCGDLRQSFSAVLRMQLEEGAWVITGLA